MFIVELAFDGNPDRLAARPAHREILQRLHGEGVVLAAGPFSDESGALLIFDVASADELAGIIAADPYYQAPGVAITRQQEWAPIIT